MPEITLNLAYNKIQILGFSLNIFEGMKIETEKKELFLFTYNFNTNINLENELFTVNLEVILSYDKKENQICNLKANYEYHVIGLKKIAKKNGGVFSIPDKIPAMLIANAISTSRGILFMKTAGTPIENIYLPVVNIDTILKSKSEKFDKEKS